MAKKKKSTRGRAKASAPQHRLPAGFWSQVGAVFLIAISVLFIVAWFGAGGPVLEWMHQTALNTIGYAVYVVPLLFVYVAVEVFRAENNRAPLAVKLATTLLIVWCAGLFGLMKDADGKATGGFIGDMANSAMLALVDSGVAAFIYVLLILVTTLFVLRVSPITVIKKLRELARTNPAEQDENVKVMRRADEATASKKAIGELKLNAGVPMLDANEVNDGKILTTL